MESRKPDRDEALELLKQYNKSESLINHGLAVEGVMRHFAGIYNEEPDEWGIIGLIHDLDYEKYPEKHCQMTEKILRENNWPDEYIRAVLSHGWQVCTDIEPRTKLEKTLYAVDELTGLITAVALVRPSRSVKDVKVKSVKKKWKQKQFAAGANREIIQRGADMLEMELSDLIAETIEGMKKVSDDIRL